MMFFVPSSLVGVLIVAVGDEEQLLPAVPLVQKGLGHLRIQLNVPLRGLAVSSWRLIVWWRHAADSGIDQSI